MQRGTISKYGRLKRQTGRVSLIVVILIELESSRAKMQLNN